jgi:hypothetical protein
MQTNNCPLRHRFSYEVAILFIVNCFVYDISVVEPFISLQDGAITLHSLMAHITCIGKMVVSYSNFNQSGAVLPECARG